MLRAGNTLKGYAIAAQDGTIGTVSDFLFDDQSWKLRWLVVDTGNWLSGRKVLLHPSAIMAVNAEDNTLTLRLTKARIQSSPGLSWDQPVSRQMEASLYTHYGWDPYWGGGYMGQGFGAIPRDLIEVRAQDGIDLSTDLADPHLRSIAAVTGYRLRATDGGIGHIQDFLIEDRYWRIGYLLADTSNWWFGQHVMLSPYAVREINWGDQEVLLDVTREKVKASPPWSAEDELDEPYEQRLHQHYGWPGYGW